MATDPVCGMDVDESDPPAQTDYQGATYFFCAEGCREKFEANPDEYV